jgi:hypothetical protein
MSREWHAAYEQIYRERPGVRKKRAAYMRQRRTDTEFLQKEKARRIIRSAIEKGLMTRQSCEVCGSSNTQAHHEDYDKPLEVKWLCPSHHAKVHAKARGA